MSPVNQPDETEEIDNELEEEEEEREEPDPPPAPNAAQAAAGVGRKPPRRKKAPPAPSTGVPQGRWTHKEAELLWVEMVESLKAQGKSPYDIEIAVYQVDPPPQMRLGPSFSGSAVAGGGSESPADAIVNMVDQNYHCCRLRTPARYELNFTWKLTGKFFGRGTLYRPDPQQIEGMRRAQMYQSPPPAYTPPMGMGAGAPSHAHAQPPAAPQQPPPAPQYPPPGYPPPYGFGAPPQQDPNMMAVMQQNAMMAGQLQAMLEFMKAQGLQPPPGLAAPPPAPPPQAQPPAPPPWYAQPPAWMQQQPTQQQPQSRMAQAREFVGMIREMKQIREEIDSALGVVRGEGEEQETVGVGATPPAVEVPQTPAEKLPFSVIPIPEANFLGKPVNYAINKETGTPDWTGIAMSNPQLAEKALDVVGRFMHAMVKAAGANIDESAPQPGNPQLAPGVAAPAVNGAAQPGGWPGA